MKKRLLSLLLIIAIVAAMVPMGVFAELTQDEKNIRTTEPPKDSSGKYSINARWNYDEAGFTDETLIEDTTSDAYIQRISHSDEMTSQAMSYFMLTTWGGAATAKAKKTDFVNENAWYQFDFGMTSKVTSIRYFTQFTNDWMRTTYASNIDYYMPKQIKIKYSNDKINWSEKTFNFDYTDEEHELNVAYLDVKANGADSEYLSSFASPLTLSFDTPARGRYFRLVMTKPTQDFVAPEDPESTETAAFDIRGLDFYDTSEPDWIGSGNGTEIDPYLISTPEHLSYLSTYAVNSRVNLTDKYFMLTDNIDMYGYSVAPIGTSATPFTATFDGNGKVISNLAIGSESSNASHQHAGLFGCIGSGGTVKNVGIESISIYNHYQDARIGGIAGKLTSGGEIRNCYVKNSYIQNGLIGVGGGVVGDNYGDIYDSYVNGTTTVKSYREGGFVGDNYGCIHNCYAASVSMPATSNLHAVSYGAFTGPSYTATVDNCYYVTSDGVSDNKATGKTADEFADGTVLNLLNSGATSLGTAWMQNESDALPYLRVFDEGSAPAQMEFAVRADKGELTGTFYDDGGCWSMANINDNNLDTCVDNQSVRCITFDLGEGNYGSVNKITYAPRNSGNWWHSAQLDGAQIQASNDNEVFETIATTSGTVQGINEITLGAPTLGYRYFRWLPADGTTTPIAELHFYGNTEANISYHSTYLTVNTKYTVKNSYNTSKTAVNYIAVYNEDGTLNTVKSAKKDYPAGTAGDIITNSLRINDVDTELVIKSFVWDKANMNPIGTADTLTYTPYKPATEFALPNYFVDDMVMQRDKDISVFGSAYAGTPISVTLADADTTLTGNATADANGDWNVVLDAQPKSGPYTLTVASENQTEVIENIHMGEVLLCAGQSNMEFNYNNWGHSQDPDFINEIADNERIKFLVGATAMNSNQGERFDIPTGSNHGWGPLTKWLDCTVDSAKGVSEIGYKVAKELTEAEEDLYVGVIAVAVGGAPIANYQIGGNYYDALIAPLTSFNIGAVLWYQGESNAPGTYYGERYRYVSSMTTLINTWRDKFGEADLPFLYVQLARHSHWWDTPYLQDEQRRVLTSDLLENKDNVAMVVSIDTDKGSGNHPTQNTAIHPAGKAVVGERLADLYKKYVLGQTDLITSGPLYASHTIEDGAIYVKFTDVADGLAIKDVDNGSFDYSIDNSALLGLDTVSEFEIAGSDKTFVTATAEIVSKDTVKVYAEGVTDPKYVRYAIAAYPENPSLANSFTVNGETQYLPASPFTTEFDK